MSTTGGEDNFIRITNKPGLEIKKYEPIYDIPAIVEQLKRIADTLERLEKILSK